MIIPPKALEQHIAILGKTGAGKTYAARGIVEGLLDDGKRVAIIDPKGDWYGLRLSHSGKSAGYPVVIFGGAHADVPINDRSGGTVGELVATGNRPSIFDLSEFTMGERTRFFMDLAAALFRHNRGPLWLVIDECHNFAHQGKVHDPDSGKMLHWANRLASEGRGKAITIIMASQRPQKVHKDFLTCAETLVAMRVVHNLDRGAIKEWTDGAGDPEKSKQVLTSLAGMERGTAWVWSPELGHFQQAKAPRIKTYDSMSPVAAAGEVLKGWADIDLEEVKGKLSEVVKESEANDPKKLKARIQQLQAEIGHFQAEMKPDPELINRAVQREQIRLEAEFKKRESRWLVVFDEFSVRMAKIAEIAHKNGIVVPKESERGISPHAEQELLAPPRWHSSERPLADGRGSDPRAGSDQKLPKAERLILSCLGSFPKGRTRVQLALMTGYSHSGGGFGNALSSLRSKGFIVGSDTLLITEDGRLAIDGAIEYLPRGRELLDWWMKNITLGKAERAVLKALERGPLNKIELAVKAGYEPEGGGFGNALSRLRTLELIRGRGEIELAEVLQ